MMKGLYTVTIFFENLDWINVPARFFEVIRFLHIISDPQCDGEKAVCAHYCPASVALKFTPNVEAASAAFDGDWRHLSSWNTLLQRFCQRDIVSVRLLYADGKEEEYLAPWEDDADNEYRNRYQCVSLGKDGEYCICIGKECE